MTTINARTMNNVIIELSQDDEWKVLKNVNDEVENMTRLYGVITITSP